MIEVETISERYRENLTREKHVLIPEHVNCLLTQDSFQEVYGYNHYKKFNISKHIYKYFYSSKFVGNMLEKPSVKKMLTLWRMQIKPVSELMKMEKFNY